jgi:hypothetical protein
MRKVETIKQIARRVRRWAVRNRRKYYTGPDLSCMCAITSAYIFQLLRDAGFSDAKVCVTEVKGHAFVHCAGYLVDVTATQFSKRYKAVEVKPIKVATDGIWKVEVELETLEAMRDYFEAWPEDQQPLERNLQ